MSKARLSSVDVYGKGERDEGSAGGPRLGPALSYRRRHLAGLLPVVR